MSVPLSLCVSHHRFGVLAISLNQVEWQGREAPPGIWPANPQVCIWCSSFPSPAPLLGIGYSDPGAAWARWLAVTNWSRCRPRRMPLSTLQNYMKKKPGMPGTLKISQNIPRSSTPWRSTTARWSLNSLTPSSYSKRGTTLHSKHAADQTASLVSATKYLEN